MRLDNYLVQELGVGSRNKAQSYIKAGNVTVDSKVVTKSSFLVEPSHEVAVHIDKEYVSRSAWKLAHFLDEIALDVSGKRALDIGSSTGGFTEVLLERGARSVCAVDVGSEQLHPTLRGDSRIELHERTDIRNFEAEPFELVVSDVSFISLLHILDAVDRLADKEIVLLFKPQFEVGREAKRDKKGVLKDPKAVMRAMLAFEDACELKGWQLVKKSPSKVSGKEGNIEYCYYFRK